MMSDTNTANLSGFPLVISTKTQGSPAKLLLRNSEGMVVQQWLIKQTKCTIGSASGCAIRCSEPGIAPYHALIVVGARQTFVRALAPKVSRNAQPFNELLLTDDHSSFELAGYRFELIRENSQTRNQSEPASPKRMKFALSKPFDANSRKPSATPDQVTGSNVVRQPSNINPESRALEDIPWVAKLIQSALEPLECQLQNLAEPLNELRAKSNRNRRRISRTVRIKSAEQTASNQVDPLSSQVENEQFASEPTIAPYHSTHGLNQASDGDDATDIQSIVTRQNVTLELLNEKIADVTAQLAVVEQIAKNDSSVLREKQELDQTAQSTQNAAIEQLQNGIIAVTDAIKRIEVKQQDHGQWKTEIDEQLTSIREAVEANARAPKVVEIPESITDTLAALQSTQVATQHERSVWKQQVEAQLERIQRCIEGAQQASFVSSDVKLNSFIAPQHVVEQSSLPSVATNADAWIDTPMVAGDPVNDTSYNWGVQDYGSFSATDNGIAEVAYGESEEISGNATEPSAPSISNFELKLAGETPNVEDERTHLESSQANGAALGSTNLNSSLASNPNEEFFFGNVGQTAKESIAPSSFHQDQFNNAVVDDPISALDWDDSADSAHLPHDLLSIPLQEELLNEPSDGPGEFMSWNHPLMDEVDLTKLTADLPSESDSFTSNSNREEVNSRSSTQLPTDAKLPSWWVEEAENNERLSKLANHEESSFDSTDGQSAIESPSAIGRVVPPEANGEFYGLGQFDHQEPEIEPARTPSLLHAAESYADAVEEETNQLDVVQEAPAIASTTHSDSTEDEDGSVEDYMRKLLARMRGVPEEEVELPKPEQPPIKPTTPTYQASGAINANSDEVESDATTVNFSREETEPFDPEKYVPRALAPEKSANLAALRDLANSTARTAISTSTRQRHLSNVLMKFAIAIIGLTVTAVLVSINGVAMNIGLIATIAALAVAVIWGYDAITSMKRLSLSDAAAARAK